MNLNTLKYKVLNQFSHYFTKDRKYIFISHQLNQTGAPMVLIDMIEEFVDHYGTENVVLFALDIDKYNLDKINKIGIKFHLYSNSSNLEELDYLLNVREDDFVLMNTTEIGWLMRDKLFSYLDEGILNKLFWYIHEDLPRRHFDHKEITQRTKVLLSSGKLEIVTLAEKIQSNYQQFFNVEIGMLQYRFRLNSDFKIKRGVEDYDKVKFLVSGSSNDGRKGQPAVLTAFVLFYEKYYKKTPNKYRNFTLTFLGIGDDYLSVLLNKMGSSLLPGQFDAIDKLPRKEALKITSKHNASICYSLMEALPLNIMEAMKMQHFLLRNDSSGMEEQLIPGENGYFLDSNDLNQFVEVIEKVLNKKKTSNEQLLKMGQSSQELVRKYEDISYVEYFLC